MSSALDQGNPWVNRLPALILSHTVGTVNIVSVMAMAPLISLRLDLSAAEFGAFISAYYVAQSFGSVPAGAVTDRIGVGRTLVIAHVLMCMAAVTLAVAVGYIQCILAMFLMGLGYSLSNPSTARGVLDWFPKERRGTAMGLKQVGVPIGGVIAAGNGALAASIDWQSIMWGVAVLIAANGIFCLSLMRFHVPTPLDQRKSIMANMGTLLGDWNFNLYAIVNGFLNVGQTNFFGFLTLFMTATLRTSQEVAGLAIGLAQTASAVARIGWGVICDRYYPNRRAFLLTMICGVAGVFLGLLALIGPGSPLWITLIVILALGMTIASFAPIAQAVVVESVEPRLAGSAIGVNMLGVHIGGAIGPIIFGWVVDNWGGYGAAWAASSAIVIAGTFALAFWFKEGGHRG